MTAPAFVRSVACAGFVALGSSAAAQAQTPAVFHACIAPLTGLMYEPKEPGKCFHPTHRAVSWTDGLGAFQAGTTLGGDLQSQLPNPVVRRIQRRPVSEANPAPGDVLAWSGTEWAPAPPTAPVLQSPNGEYSLSITDAGLELRGPNQTKIRLFASGMEIHSGLMLDVRSVTSTRMRAGTNLSLEGNGNTDVRAGINLSLVGSGPTDVRGSIIALNSGGCPVARLGSQVAGPGVPPGEAFTGIVVNGSPTVLTPC